MLQLTLFQSFTGGSRWRISRKRRAGRAWLRHAAQFHPRPRGLAYNASIPYALFLRDRAWRFAMVENRAMQTMQVTKC